MSSDDDVTLVGNPIDPCNLFPLSPWMSESTCNLSPLPVDNAHGPYGLGMISVLKVLGHRTLDGDVTFVGYGPCNLFPLNC